MRLFNTILTIFWLGITFPASTQPVFNFVQDEYDFGLTEEGEKLTYSFEFINGGKDTIHLKEETRDVRPGCSCTASEYTRTPIPPGDKGFVTAGYQTQGRLGAFQKNITISQKGKPCKTLAIKGIVVKKIDPLPAPSNPKKLPSLVINKKDHYFGKVEKGQNVIWNFNINNTGKDTLKIRSFYAACKCIEYKLLNTKDNSTINFILPGKSALLQITYSPMSPDALSDVRTLDILTLLTNDPANQKLLIKLSADLEENINGNSPIKDNSTVPFQK